MRATHITVILSVLLGSFRAFDIIYFSTSGQPGGRTDIAGTYIYKATLGLDRIGYAAAASIILLVVALSFSIVQVIVRRKATLIMATKSIEERLPLHTRPWDKVAIYGFLVLFALAFAAPLSRRSEGLDRSGRLRQLHLGVDAHTQWCIRPADLSQ